MGGLFFDFEPSRTASRPSRRVRERAGRGDGAWRHPYAIAATHNTNPREIKPHDVQP